MSSKRAMSKRRSRSKRQFRSKRRGPSNKSLDKKIKKLQQDVELKYKDTYTVDDIENTAQYILLNGIQQGDTTVTRTGGEIRCTSIHLRGVIQTDTAGLVSNSQRFLVVWDRQPNGAAPTLSGTVNSILDVSIVTDLILAPYNYSALDRFKILYDKNFIINRQIWKTQDVNNDVDSYCDQQIRFNKKIKLGRRVKYAVNSTAGNITDIQTNSLYFIYVGDVAAASAGPELQLGTRLYFKDA